jgi:RNA polymerase sigma-70 factor (ECF subfamily)
MAGSHRDVPELVRAAQHGDRSAFATLYERYTGMVHAIALSRLRGADVADAVQETFLRALRKLTSLREAGAFTAWLSTIARNVVHDVERCAEPRAGDGEEPALEPTQEHEMDGAAARRAISGLPKAYRKTVTLRVLHGMTGPEIARRTGHSSGSVRVNLHRGMKLLRAKLRSVRL